MKAHSASFSYTKTIIKADSPLTRLYYQYDCSFCTIIDPLLVVVALQDHWLNWYRSSRYSDWLWFERCTTNNIYLL